MTGISLKKDDVFGYSEVTVSGHSGYSEEGSDIVCAYISSASELLMCILADEAGVEIETDINPEKAFVSIRVLPTPDNQAKAGIISVCIGGFLRQMKDFSKQFPKYVSIRIV